MLVKLAVALLVLSVLEQVVGSDNTDIHDSPVEKPASQKGRLSLQNTGKEICVSSGKNVENTGWGNCLNIDMGFVRTRVRVAAN